MMNRREALLGISAAALVGAVPSASALVKLLEPVPQTNDAANASADERLRMDLARIESHANSEEGVPVFLACMNLVPDRHSHHPRPIMPPALSTAVAAQFRQTAAAWERVRPKSTAGDVASVIVVLANRDFAKGRTEQPS